MIAKTNSSCFQKIDKKPLPIISKPEIIKIGWAKRCVLSQTVSEDNVQGVRIPINQLGFKPRKKKPIIEINKPTISGKYKPKLIL